jgi:hypothetical protein
MTFSKRRNRLTMYFSERIPVVKWRMAVLEIRLWRCCNCLYFDSTSSLFIGDATKQIPTKQMFKKSHETRYNGQDESWSCSSDCSYTSSDGSVSCSSPYSGSTSYTSNYSDHDVSSCSEQDSREDSGGEVAWLSAGNSLRWCDVVQCG